MSAISSIAQTRQQRRSALTLRCRTIAVSAFASCLFGNAAFADSYRVELNAGGLSSDTDQMKITGFDASATVYLEPVQTVDTIVAESAFLNKSSSVTLGYLDLDNDIPSGDTSSDAVSVDARYVMNEKWIFEAGLADGEASDIDVSTYSLGVGAYIDDLTSIVLNYSQIDVDGAKDKLNDYSLQLKSIVDPTETDRAVGSVAAGVSQSPTANTIINLAAGLDYYFGPRFSVGGGVGLAFPNNGSDENSYSINSRYFITKAIGVGASYTHTIFQEEDDTASIDPSDTFTLTLTGRF